MDDLYLLKEYTGHQYYGSPIESYDNCGTCDGARCDVCKTKYSVENWSTEVTKKFSDYKEALECYNEAHKRLSLLITYDVPITEIECKYVVVIKFGELHDDIVVCDSINELKDALISIQKDKKDIMLRQKYTYLYYDNGRILLNDVVLSKESIDKIMNTNS